VKFTSAEQLKPYINESVLENAEDLLKLAQKMSGEKLNLYNAKLVVVGEKIG